MGSRRLNSNSREDMTADPVDGTAPVYGKRDLMTITDIRSRQRALTSPAQPAYSVTGRPGLLIVPGGQYQVMISTASRPARTAGSASAS